MRVVVIGGSGHVGTFLVPRLLEAGHEVVSVSRGRREPYRDHAAWVSVEKVALDREREEKNGVFEQKILGFAPDAVIDMICFMQGSTSHLVEKLRGRVQHFLHCGTIWVHGHSTRVPATEDLPRRRPFGAYGERKAKAEAYLLGKTLKRPRRSVTGCGRLAAGDASCVLFAGGCAWACNLLKLGWRG